MAGITNKNTPDPPVHTPTPTVCEDVQKVFVECEKLLSEEEKSSNSANEALKAVQDGKRNDVCAERRSYNKSKKIFELYTSIQNCQAIGLCADIEQAQETVKRKTALAAEVKKGFDGILTSIKTLKDKMKTAHQLACQVDAAIHESTNKTTKDLINTALGKLTPPRKIGGEPGKEEPMYDQFSKQALEGVNAVDQAFETAVNVAGIYAYTNLASIKSHTDGLKTQCDLFKTDAENNIKLLDADLKTAQTNLSTALLQMSLAEADYARSQTVDDAVRETLEKVRNHRSNTGDVVPTLLQKPGTAADPVENIIDKRIQAILGKQGLPVKPPITPA
jgi:hypothetical protein